MNDERHQWLKKKKRYNEAYRAALEETERRRKELQTTAEDSSPLEWLRHQDSLYKPLRQRRADRKAAMVDADVLRDWVRVSEIATHWADDKKLTLEKARQEVGNRIVLDSAEGRLGTKKSPALMLLSAEYDKEELSPSGLDDLIRAGFADLAEDVRKRMVSEFLADHGWIRRSAAARWPGIIPVPPAAENAPIDSINSSTKRRGSPPQYDWEVAHDSAKKTFFYREDFQRAECAEDGWRSQADLERMIQGVLEKCNNEPPSQNTVRRHLVKWLPVWRAELANK